MKKLITLFLFSFPLVLMAQELSVSEFYMDLKDQTANNELTKKIDDNGEVCALIRIETSQKGFVFDGGTIGIVEIDESKVGEIWVYVPAGLSRITIRHQQLGTLRDYYFPDRLRSARTYVMKLISGSVVPVVQAKSTVQWIVVNYEPKDAMVEIDGVVVEGSDGVLRGKLTKGKHDVRVSAANYHSEMAKVELGDDKVELSINLLPAFGWIDVDGPAGASVYIDNRKIGVAPLKSQPLPSGNYDLRVVKDKWIPYREQVLVSDNEVSKVSPILTANFVSVNVKTESNAEIWIDDVKHGIGSVIVELIPGQYTFQSRIDGHMSQSIVKDINMGTVGVIEIPAPVALVGSLSVDVNPAGAKVYVDGQFVGQSPFVVDDILVGLHQVKITNIGFHDENKTVDIREGQTKDISLSMRPKPLKETASLNKNISGIIIEDGVLIYVPNNYGKFVIGDDVTSIGGRAFFDCKNMKGIVIPEGVTEIGNEAFMGCKCLDSVIVPNSVVSIGESAFKQCEYLKYVSFGNSLKYIGNSAFADCHSLYKISIPGSVSYFGAMAFCNCWRMRSVSLQTGITYIPNGAFSDCFDLMNVSVPNSVKSIGSSAFYRCDKLLNISLPDGLTDIGAEAFRLSGLTSVNIPDAMTYIPDYAFYECKYLKNIIIPEQVTTIGSYAFAKCSSITKILIPGTVKIVKSYAFCHCEYVKYVKIEEGVTNIGKGAFYECSGCYTFVLPSSIVFIGEDAFFRGGGICLPYIYVPEKCGNKIKKFLELKMRKYVYEEKRPTQDAVL